jgi:hypothetical protein
MGSDPSLLNYKTGSVTHSSHLILRSSSVKWGQWWYPPQEVAVRINCLSNVYEQCLPQTQNSDEGLIIMVRYEVGRASHFHFTEQAERGGVLLKVT